MGIRTNSSAALPVKGAGFVEGDGSLCRLSLTVPESSRKGFLDSGLGGGSIGESWPDATGEVVRLRKGLLEGRLRPAAFASIRARSWSVTVSLSIVSWWGEEEGWLVEKPPKTTVFRSQTANSGVAICRTWAINVRIAYLRYLVARKPCLFLYGDLACNSGCPRIV